MAFPTSIDSFAGFTSSHTLAADSHAAQSNAEQAGLVATETKVGTGASTPTNGTVLAGNGVGTSTWRALTNADVGLGNVSNTSLVGILGAVYPVGAIYTETTGTNPATTFGFGTWAAYAQGQVMVGYKAGDPNFGTAGGTGGEATHTLTSTEMPAHNHTITDPGHTHTITSFNSGGGGGGAPLTSNNTGGSSNPSTSTSTTGVTTNNTGSNGAHNNLQPYLTVYIWIRNA